MIGYSNATAITAIVAGFFILLALIALARTLFTHTTQPRRYRVGVFVERDTDQPPAEWPTPRGEFHQDTLIKPPPDSAPKPDRTPYIDPDS